MASSRLNILFILADDLGYADVSCYGRRDFTTPNIDRLAAEGVRFTQAYANSAVCTASRVALITGRYQYRLAVGLEEPLSTRVPRKIGSTGGPSDPAVAPEESRLPISAVSANGIWGGCPISVRCREAYDYFYGFRSGAVDYFTHKSGPRRPIPMICGQDDVHQSGYLTDIVGRPRVDLVETYAGTGNPS